MYLVLTDFLPLTERQHKLNTNTGKKIGTEIPKFTPPMLEQSYWLKIITLHSSVFFYGSLLTVCSRLFHYFR